MKLVLVRNCQTLWSEENKFMGWTDVPLSEEGINLARELGRRLAEENIDFGIAYTSVLARAKDTLKYIEEGLQKSIKTRVSYKLNAKHYGILEGMYKSDAKEKYGQEQIAKWRVGFTEKAPEISVKDERFPGNSELYKDILKFELPLSESQHDVYDRVVEYFEHEISTFLKVDENVLLVAHGSTLRVLTKYLESISDEDMPSIEIPAGSIVIYDLDDDLMVQNKRIISL